MAITEGISSNSSNGEQILFTVEQTSHYLQISRATIYKLFRSGDLIPLKIGNSTRVSERAINRYVNLLESRAKERLAHTVKGQAE